MDDFDEDIDEGLNIGVDNGESRREPVDGAGTCQGKKKVFTTTQMDRSMS